MHVYCFQCAPERPTPPAAVSNHSGIRSKQENFLTRYEVVGYVAQPLTFMCAAAAMELLGRARSSLRHQWLHPSIFDDAVSASAAGDCNCLAVCLLCRLADRIRVLRDVRRRHSLPSVRASAWRILPCAG